MENNAFVKSLSHTVYLFVLAITPHVATVAVIGDMT